MYRFQKIFNIFCEFVFISIFLRCLANYNYYTYFKLEKHFLTILSKTVIRKNIYDIYYIVYNIYSATHSL